MAASATSRAPLGALVDPHAHVDLALSFGAVHANLGQRLPPRRTAPRTRWGGNGWATVMTLKPLRPAHSIASADVAAAQNGG